MRSKIAAIAISALIAAPPVFAQTQTQPPAQPPSSQQPQTQQPQTPPDTQQPQEPRTHQQPSNPGKDRSTDPSSTNKDNMPRTASSTTLIGLIGVATFGAGIALSAIRRRRAFQL
jgi:hypothetical protein